MHSRITAGRPSFLKILIQLDRSDYLNQVPTLRFSRDPPGTLLLMLCIMTINVTIVKVGTKVSSGNNVAVKMQHVLEHSDEFGSVKKTTTYYMSKVKGSVKVKEGQKKPLNLDLYDVVKRPFTFVKEGVEITVQLKWLVPKPSAE